MIKVTLTQTRPSVDVPFYGELHPEDAREGSKFVRSMPGFVSNIVQLSEDRKTVSSVTIFKDQEAVDNYRTHNSSERGNAKAARDTYNTANDITTEITDETV